MTTEIVVIDNQWYDNLVEELKDLITEVEFSARWTLVEGYHSLGARILQENNNFEREKIYGDNIAQRIAQSLQKSKRTINYAIQFAKLYPDLDLLPEGKNISFHHIINKYLTNGEKQSIIVTRGQLMKQIAEIKKLLQTEYQKELQSVNNGEIATNKSNLEFIRYLQDQVDMITSIKVNRAGEDYPSQQEASQ